MATDITDFVALPRDISGYPAELAESQHTETERDRAGWRKAAAGISFVAKDALAVVVAAKALEMVSPALAQNPAVVPALTLAAASQIGLRMTQRLYPGYGLHLDAAMRRGVTTWAGAALIAAASAHLLLDAGAGVIAAVIATFMFAGLLQILFSTLARIGLSKAGLWGLPVHVIGDPDRVDALESHLASDRRLGYTPVALDESASVMLWAGEGPVDPETISAFLDCYPEVILASDQPKLSLSGFQSSHHGGEIGLRLSRPGSSVWYAVLKRAFDLAVAIPVAIAAAPVVILAGIAIRLADPGPIFYSQVREGLRGRKIRVLKLRTMYQDSDRMLKELLERDPVARAEWNNHFKLRNDPRILPVVGPLLREFSLDELPQIINIIVGDMSLVGPRPFPEYHLEAMCPKFRVRRASVMPGLTGIWQISERSTADVALQEKLDGYYLDNRSFWLDVSILFRTASAVFGRKGAY